MTSAPPWNINSPPPPAPNREFPATPGTAAYTTTPAAPPPATPPAPPTANPHTTSPMRPETTQAVKRAAASFRPTPSRKPSSIATGRPQHPAAPRLSAQNALWMTPDPSCPLKRALRRSQPSRFPGSSPQAAPTARRVDHQQPLAAARPPRAQRRQRLLTGSPSRRNVSSEDPKTGGQWTHGLFPPLHIQLRTIDIMSFSNKAHRLTSPNP